MVKAAGGVLLLTLGVSCIPIHFEGGVPVDPGPMDRRPATPAATGVGLSSSSELRRVCRGSRPGGWIAIEYINDTESCPAARTGGKVNQTAVVVRYSGVPVGSQLTVCAEERVPRDWVRDSYDAAGSQCPPGSDAEPARGVMVIRRVR